MPNQGLQILYEILNERDDALAERGYAPWVDMTAEMRAASVPLFSVDTHHDAADFDVLAFGLAAELVYTNVLECLDLAGVPVRAAERRPEHPLVVVGGHCAFNPEPMTDFVDAFVIGDGEEAVGEITEVVGAWKRSGRTAREGVLRELATIPGRLRAVDVRRRVRRAVHRRGPAAVRRDPRTGRQAHGRGPGGMALSQEPARARSSRWCTTGSTSRCSAVARAGVGSARRG